MNTMKKQISALPRLQQIFLWLQPYDKVMKYKSGNEMLLADALQHLPRWEEQIHIPLDLRVDQYNLQQHLCNWDQKTYSQLPSLVSGLLPKTPWLISLLLTHTKSFLALKGHARWALHWWGHVAEGLPHCYSTLLDSHVADVQRATKAFLSSNKLQETQSNGP